jgi:hypothetical protein
LPQRRDLAKPGEQRARISRRVRTLSELVHHSRSRSTTRTSPAMGKGQTGAFVRPELER